MERILELPASELKHAFAGLSKVLSTKSTLPVLRYVRLALETSNTVSLAATDLDTTVTCRIKLANPAEFPACLIPFEPVSKVFRNQKDQISLVANDSRLLLRYRVGSVSIDQPLDTVALEEWPVLPEIKAKPFSLVPAFKVALREALECVSEEDSRYVLQGVCLDASQPGCHHVVSTDGRHLYAANTFKFNLADMVILPDRKFLHWAGWYEVEDDWSMAVQPGKEDKPGYIQIQSERWTFITKSIDGKYPNWRQVIPESDCSVTRLSLPEEDASLLLKALPHLPQGDEINQSVMMSIRSGRLVLSSCAKGSATPTEVPVPGARITGKDREVSMNRKFILKALRFGLHQFVIADEHTPVVFTGPGKKLVAMPVRLNGTPAKESKQTTSSTDKPETPTPNESQPMNTPDPNASETHPLSSDELFEFIATSIRENPSLAQIIQVHITAETGHYSLPSYHNNGATEEQKVQLYTLIATAIDSGDYSLLKGQIATGQAVPPPEVEIKPEPPAPAALPEVKPSPKVDPKPVQSLQAQPVTVAPPVTTPDMPMDPMALFAQFMNMVQSMSKPQPSSAPAIDEEKIKAIVAAHLQAGEARQEARLKEWLDQASKVVNTAVAEAVQKLPPRDVIEIRAPEGVREIKGSVHFQAAKFATLLKAGVPVWAWGAPGAGKTHMVLAIAEMLGVEAKILSVDPTTTNGKILGFRSLTTGEFIEGIAYRPFKEGGLMVLDEIDKGDPGVIACSNALLSNECYTFPNGEFVRRHPNFHVMALANTKGTGAVAGHTASVCLDAATLDRFFIVECLYDEGLEMQITCGIRSTTSSWKPGPRASAELKHRYVEWVQRIRKHVGRDVLISPRATLLGVRALDVGVPPQEVADGLVFKLVDDGTKERIIQTLGEVPHD